MDPIAMATIMAAVVGLVEAASPFIPDGGKPISSTAFGVALGLVYVVLPPEVQPSFLIILAGATGTGAVAIAKRIGGAA